MAKLLADLLVTSQFQLQHAEQELRKERKELDNLRTQMKEMELSYISQIKSHEKYAEESAVSRV